MKRESHENPVLIVIAGPNGSSKTSFVEQIHSHRWYKIASLSIQMKLH